MIRLRYLCFLSIFLFGFGDPYTDSFKELRSECVNPSDSASFFCLIFEIAAEFLVKLVSLLCDDRFGDFLILLLILSVLTGLKLSVTSGLVQSGMCLPESMYLW